MSSNFFSLILYSYGLMVTPIAKNRILSPLRPRYLMELCCVRQTCTQLANNLCTVMGVIDHANMWHALEMHFAVWSIIAIIMKLHLSQATKLHRACIVSVSVTCDRYSVDDDVSQGNAAETEAGHLGRQHLQNIYTTQ